MTAAWKRLKARGAERGATESLELVIVAPILVILLVLCVAGGNIVRGNGAVDAAAASATRAASLQRSPDKAARAGLQAASPGAGTDPSAVTQAAERYLSAANTDGNLSGTARLDGTQLNVSVTVTTKTTFLGLLNIDQLTARGTGRADLVRGLN